MRGPGDLVPLSGWMTAATNQPTPKMIPRSIFAGSIETLVTDLRSGCRSHADLWRAAARIDHLGRHLYGLGYSNAGEIAARFTAAIGALGAAHEMPEAQRRAGIEEAAGALEAALDQVNSEQPTPD